jgi:tRNA (guanine-N7-)-methyltransferase
LAQLVGLIDRGGLQNLRMIRGDAVVVLDELVEPKSLLGIRVFFPDPWPKARHHKRRFLQSGTLATMAEKLVDGGVLHIATDHADYTEWIRELLENQDTTQTHVVPLTGDSPISLARPTTKFESRAADEGRTVTEFVLVRAEGRR